MALVIGKDGLIGKEIAKHVNTTVKPLEETDVIYDFGSPTHPTFQEDFNFHNTHAIERLLKLLPHCKEHDILYVFPSSALVYEDREMPFIHSKLACEEIIKSYGIRYLILRIWPVYGNEAHKGEHASVMYKWQQQIKHGETIEVYGNGEQKRAFISVEEVVKIMLKAVKEGRTGTYDISGEEKSFNQILKEIGATKIKYVKAPEGYSLISPKPQNELSR